MSIRSPICSVLGHVDHGKSSILDKVRGSAIVDKEAGGITQAIGASIIPMHAIKKVAGTMMDAMNINFTIPGLLFIDTPGHAAFTSLRKRGGSIADIAILVVDINEGFKPQTIESIEILKTSKTPFIVAANKVDKIQGWVTDTNKPILKNIADQPSQINQQFETKMYELVGNLAEYGLNAERFDRVHDYTQQIALVPTSAMTGEGIPELLMVLAGLAQRYMEKKLEIDETGTAKGTILEVKEEKGIGTSVDAIIYDGKLKVGDNIAVGGLNGAVISKIKGLFEPAPLAEMRDKKSKFKAVKEVTAAIGVKIVAKGTEEVISGMPIISFDKDDKAAEEEVQSQVQEVIIDTEDEGIIIKADSLGSLEGLVFLLREKGIPIRKAMIGDISKKDIIDAESNYEKDPFLTAILGFNVKNTILEVGHVKVILGDIIYRIIDDYEKWVEVEKKKLEMKHLESITRPCKIELLKGYVFRQSNPAIVGVHILEGTLKSGMPVMNTEGVRIAQVKGLQLEQKNVEEAERGKQVAVSIPGVTVGRQVKEGDILYSDVSEDDFRQLKESKKFLGKDELETIKEIAKIKRAKNPVWGV